METCKHEYVANLAGTYEWCQQCDSIRPTSTGEGCNDAAGSEVAQVRRPPEG